MSPGGVRELFPQRYNCGNSGEECLGHASEASFQRGNSMGNSYRACRNTVQLTLSFGTLSIHPFSPAYSYQGCRGLEPIPNIIGQKVHPKQCQENNFTMVPF